MGPPKMVSGTHTIPISLGILMGVVWESYHKGVPLLGVPENPIEISKFIVSSIYTSCHWNLRVYPVQEIAGLIEGLPPTTSLQYGPLRPTISWLGWHWGGVLGGPPQLVSS